MKTLTIIYTNRFESPPLFLQNNPVPQAILFRIVPRITVGWSNRVLKIGITSSFALGSVFAYGMGGPSFARFGGTGRLVVATGGRQERA